MQGGNQQPPSSAANDSLSTLAFLGQQLRQFSNSMPHQRHQNQSLGFSLSVNGQEHGHGHQNHQQQHSQSMLLGGSGGGQANGGNRSGMFQHLQQQGNMNSSLDQQQFGNQMMNPNFSENITSQSTVEQNVQGIMEHLSMLQERIQQLQALVPLIAQTAHCQTDSNVVAQQQAASAAVVSIISQLAMAAIGLLPQPFGNSGVQANQSTELPLSQLLQAAVNPTANFFQNTLGSDLRAPQRGSSINNLMNTNIFGTSAAAAAVSGVNTGVSGLRSFSNGGHAFPGLNNDSDLSGQQNLTGQQPGGSSNSPAMSLHNQMTNNGVGKDFGSVGGNGGKSRGGPVNPPNILNSSLAQGSGANNFISELGGMNTGLEDLDNDSRVDDDDSDGENLPPGSFDLVELDATEILAEHTHFCEICGKGFKRDANLRMHMRGHGDEYKTPAALARPDRGTQDTTVTRSRRFSCPYVGCKRNKKHRKFQPLKTMLCVKNHYRRSHCPKVLTCQKCMAKKFSVVADLKTHEKHCGRDKWLCSCGTTFSRKDKLFGHIGLFQGHTPAMPMHELEGGSGGGNGSTPVQEHESPTEGSFGSETKSSMRFWD
ncbi:hypothetical protein KC19_1G127000 [Ceratodon purpureus]|uniref:C2H2-type domain-containing protein n=1 Tax=Ceratodon purpureus TaxID=3225 RepID=A0A8T0J7H2_CERPU|nr:hypothetical protein KC19_1G127000 [Ceratodon purpureus]